MEAGQFFPQICKRVARQRLLWMAAFRESELRESPQSAPCGNCYYALICLRVRSSFLRITRYCQAHLTKCAIL